MPEPAPAAGWHIERYREGDEHALLELFRTVFGRARSVEHWRWQFRDNPYGGPYVSIARRDHDGLVVGSHIVWPVSLSVMGRPVRACQSVDTAVHPEHRGQRIFEATASDVLAWCASEGFVCAFCFPNASSYPGFVRTLEWRRILFPVKYTLRLGVGAALRKAMPIPLLPEIADVLYRTGRTLQLDTRRAMARRLGSRRLAFERRESVPDGYDALWKSWSAQEVLSIWKDSAYLQWRYDRNPDQRFSYAVLLDGDETVALAVVTVIDDILQICDLIVKNRDVLAGRRLVGEIARLAASESRRAVSFLGSDSGFFDDVLVGFDRQKAYGNVFCGRAFEPGFLAELFPNAGNWSITFGDGDFV